MTMVTTVYRRGGASSSEVTLTSAQAEELSRTGTIRLRGQTYDSACPWTYVPAWMINRHGEILRGPPSQIGLTAPQMEQWAREGRIKLGRQWWSARPREEQPTLWDLIRADDLDEEASR